MPVQFTTPAGRIVWGHPRNSQDVIDSKTKQPRTDADGNKKKKWAFGLAIPKADCQPLFDAQAAAAAEIFAQGTPDGFAWKFKDGDKVDKDGKPYADREGWAGCYVFALETQFQMPPNYEFDYAANRWVDTDKTKRGDWVTVALNINPHKAISNESKPGLYMNPDVVMLYKADKEIKGGSVDPNARGFAPPPQQTPPANAPTPPGATTQTPAPPSGPRPPGGAPTQTQQPNPHQAFLRGPQPDAN